MPFDSHLPLVCTLISIIAGFATLGGWIAHFKRRPPLEGVLLGFFLGPIGLLMELRFPYVHRPIVDEKALHSLQSMLVYQASGREYERRKGRGTY